MYPHERSLVEEMRNRPFALLGVNSDPKLETVKAAVQSEKLTWRSWWDGSTRGPISSFYSVRGWPTIYVIDATGVIRYKNVRGDALAKAVEELVAEAESAKSTELVKHPIQGMTPELREWTDNSGQFRVKASFVTFRDGSVQLEGENGRDIRLPMSRLSKEDQEHIRSMLRDRAKAKRPAAKR